MIKFEDTRVMNWEAAVRGMRNPMNSWKKSDSNFTTTAHIDILNDAGEVETAPVLCDALAIGDADHELMMRLRNAGSDHRKFMRQIIVSVDITAPLYWWKEFDTYKVGTVANSCSTMHKIHDKEFTLDDFSCEHLNDTAMSYLRGTINYLNDARSCYNWCNTKAKKDWWWQMIQLLPSSYNQKRTVTLNYEVLANIYISRKNHKLDEWRDLCKWVETLPYSEIITGKESKE